jgi:hypothetical protein
MKLAVALVTIAFLVGCSHTVPVVKPEFPTPPDLLMRKPEPLKSL